MTNYSKLLMFHGLPLFIALLPIVWFSVSGDYSMFLGESGLVEIGTVMFLGPAIGFCLSSLWRAKQQGLSGFLNTWIVILIIGTAYFALEEISYGQHIFNWDTSESWGKINDQQETNLHNTSRLLNQIPRSLLVLGIMIGCIVMPIYRHFRNIELAESNRFYWQWPTMDCITIGIVVILIRPVILILEQVASEYKIISIAEMKEFTIALFILVYCASIHSRLAQKMTSAEFRHAQEKDIGIN